MYWEGLTDPPRDEAHFWEMMKDNFAEARHILSLPLQTRDEALGGDEDEIHEPASCLFIPYRASSEGHDHRQYFYDLGNVQIARLEKLFAERRLDFEFVQAWGVLMCALGYTLNYVMDGSKLLGAERAAAASAESRSLVDQRRWLAHVMLPHAKGWGKRSASEKHAVELIQKIVANEGIGGFPAEWFSVMLADVHRKKHGRAELKSSFQQQKFSVKEMEEAVGYGAEGLPPTEKFFT